ncbi:hypothetical protein U0070_003292 [Myodes glareolus]|uniref:Uncharacterized protein n=1 Tax=Myodes glareolus TaxID=447135 RepID=A0AAW0HTJ6_MYOGA
MPRSLPTLFPGLQPAFRAGHRQVHTRFRALGTEPPGAGLYGPVLQSRLRKDPANQLMPGPDVAGGSTHLSRRR